MSPRYSAMRRTLFAGAVALVCGAALAGPNIGVPTKQEPAPPASVYQPPPPVVVAPTPVPVLVALPKAEPKSPVCKEVVLREVQPTPGYQVALSAISVSTRCAGFINVNGVFGMVPSGAITHVTQKTECL
jgi:hypothetical protein